MRLRNEPSLYLENLIKKRESIITNISLRGIDLAKNVGSWSVCSVTPQARCSATQTIHHKPSNAFRFPLPLFFHQYEYPIYLVFW